MKKKKKKRFFLAPYYQRGNDMTPILSIKIMGKKLQHKLALSMPGSELLQIITKRNTTIHGDLGSAGQTLL